MSYPMEAQRVSMNHIDGTKAYHLGIVVNAAGKSLVTFRWGKIGIFGEVQIHKFDTQREAEKFYESKLRSKTSGGYEVKVNKNEAIYSETEFRLFFGVAMMAKFQADEVHHIDPSAKTDGMKLREDPRLDEDGKLSVDTIRKKAEAAKLEVEKLKSAMAAAEAQENLEVYSKNPLWGAF